MAKQPWKRILYYWCEAIEDECIIASDSGKPPNCEECEQPTLYKEWKDEHPKYDPKGRKRCPRLGLFINPSNSPLCNPCHFDGCELLEALKEPEKEEK